MRPLNSQRQRQELVAGGNLERVDVRRASRVIHEHVEAGRDVEDIRASNTARDSTDFPDVLVGTFRFVEATFLDYAATPNIEADEINSGLVPGEGLLNGCAGHRHGATVIQIQTLTFASRVVQLSDEHSEVLVGLNLAGVHPSLNAGNVVHADTVADFIQRQARQRQGEECGIARGAVRTNLGSG